MKNHKMQMFAGSASRVLAGKIAEYLDMELSDVTIGEFPDGETMVKVDANVRGSDVFVVQSTCPPVNHNLMELLIVLDCLKRASAARITAVIPYFGYARQDRKDEGRVPITAKMVANLITAAGADRVLTMELHAAQIQGFFDIPVDHLYAGPVLNDYLKAKNIPDLVVVSPDIGSSKIAQAHAKRLGAGLAIVNKERISAERVETGYLVGDVKGKNAVMVDDLIATAASIRVGAELLKQAGAKDLYVVATHAVFCGDAHENLSKGPFREVAVTNTILLDEKWNFDRLKILSVAEELGDAMRAIHRNESVSSLFDRKFSVH